MKFSKQNTTYESETTVFLKKLKAERPHLEAAQSEGRKILWDKGPLDLETQACWDEARVKQQGYVYQTH